MLWPTTSASPCMLSQSREILHPARHVSLCAFMPDLHAKVCAAQQTSCLTIRAAQFASMALRVQVAHPFLSAKDCSTGCEGADASAVAASDAALLDAVS